MIYWIILGKSCMGSLWFQKEINLLVLVVLLYIIDACLIDISKSIRSFG